MKWALRLTAAAVALALFAHRAPAQESAAPAPPSPTVVEPGAIPEMPSTAQPVEPGADDGSPASGLEAESLPRELAEDVARTPTPRAFGPTPVSEVNLLMDALNLRYQAGGVRSFGWVEGGYSGSSSGPGLLSVQPRQNRFGNEFLLNQIGWVIQKPLRQDVFDVGFNVRYFAGADASLGAAKGGIGSPPGNPRFGEDFRDLYLSAHLPILTAGGVDFKSAA